MIPGAAVSLAAASWRYDVGVHLSTLIVPGVLLTSPAHGDGRRRHAWIAC